METMVPVTPAVLLMRVQDLRVNAALPLRQTGWSAEQIARKYLGHYGNYELSQTVAEAEILNQTMHASWGRPSWDGLRTEVEKLLGSIRERIFSLLEKEGVSVSSSAYNADEDILTIYKNGEPKFTL